MKDLDRLNKIIMEGVVQISKNLGISTLCEGVETEEKYKFEKKAGIDYSGLLVDRKSISYTNWWFKIFHLVLPMVDDRCLIDFIEIFVDTIN